jgi:hypothetical protein
MRNGQPRTGRGNAPFTNDGEEHRGGKEHKGKPAGAHTSLLSHASAALRQG